MPTRKEIFAQLSGLDITPFKEQKGKLNYLGWAAALHILQSLFDEVCYEVQVYTDSEKVEHLFHPTGNGASVVVRLSIEGHEHEEVFPIMDNRNASVDLFKVDARDVSDSIKRAFVKAAAHFGLALSLYNKTKMPPAERIAYALLPVELRFEQVSKKLDVVQNKNHLKAMFKGMLPDEREHFTERVRKLGSEMEA